MAFEIYRTWQYCKRLKTPLPMEFRDSYPDKESVTFAISHAYYGKRHDGDLGSDPQPAQVKVVLMGTTPHGGKTDLQTLTVPGEISFDPRKVVNFIRSTLIADISKTLSGK
tara:strand:+ start:1242 stop:1574 length:333 start_codon:yes stop_codon:yes gene_type:complete